ncbi:hypothetical protein [Pseudochryseolinea flava]|uniref:Uncharacterized protein n=1 Tax=Pseudochryseolinea flava TaxID=2059302 RepID=A0A364XVM8_9BACT|nr:hypothetical protein [Pseudochryseolinea flava]RAV98229.1 hypothetical protein DQQ10_24825 [Pseudochryseolinea flava]
MSTYYTTLLKTQHELPTLLVDLCTFVGTQSHGSLGWFDNIGAEDIPSAWDPSAAEKLNAHGFAFIQLPDGSFIALLNTGTTGAPYAVVLLGSEGEFRTIANSLEEFIILWSKGETGVHDLDDKKIDGRDNLVAWIKARRMKAPKAKDFDFGAWLDNASTAKVTDTIYAERTPTDAYEKLGPKMRTLVDMMGRRADDEALITWVTQTLGKKVPAHTSNDSVNVTAPKLGIELVFSHNVLNEKYPPIKKSARSFIPYLSHAWIREKIGEPIFGIDLKNSTEEDAIRSLGQPDGRRPQFATDTEPVIAYWHKVVDQGADIVLVIESDDGISIDVTVKTSSALEEYPEVSTHLFVAWACEKGLLDETRFVEHAALFQKVKTRQARGAELVATALTRGLWENHLINKPGLRRTAYQWFHNMKNLWITADLKKVFGARKGPYGHDEPAVDNDHWDNVDLASKAFHKVFDKWLD